MRDSQGRDYRNAHCVGDGDGHRPSNRRGHRAEPLRVRNLVRERGLRRGRHKRVRPCNWLGSYWSLRACALRQRLHLFDDANDRRVESRRGHRA